MRTEVKDEGLKRFMRSELPKLLRKFRVERVVFFGSRVGGNPAQQSDVDLIVISQDFVGMRTRERMVEVALLVTPRGGHVDVLCYTPEEFAHMLPVSSFLRQCLETGVSIGGEELRGLVEGGERTGQ
jgi:predicted nucleotidyltransferase